jgi:redox-sensitive bicupin YhaK (pirin superfamily)
MDVLKPHLRDLGGGLMVSRVLPGHPHQMVGPFIFFDQMGPMTAAPGQNVDVRPHPHIGLATVTWLFEGEMVHRDSLGAVQPIAPGDVNWMTAGRGIVHSERGDPALRKSARRMYGVQSWVALPKTHEDAEPEFNHHPAATLPKIRMPGVEMRLIAGNAYGEKMDGPRHIWWNFVASSKQRIEDAKQRWREQRFAAVPGDTEFIPLPEH